MMGILTNLNVKQTGDNNKENCQEADIVLMFDQILSMRTNRNGSQQLDTAKVSSSRQF